MQQLDRKSVLDILLYPLSFLIYIIANLSGSSPLNLHEGGCLWLTEPSRLRKSVDIKPKRALLRRTAEVARLRIQYKGVAVRRISCRRTGLEVWDYVAARYRNGGFLFGEIDVWNQPM